VGQRCGRPATAVFPPGPHPDVVGLGWLLAGNALVAGDRRLLRPDPVIDESLQERRPDGRQLAVPVFVFPGILVDAVEFALVGPDVAGQFPLLGPDRPILLGLTDHRLPADGVAVGERARQAPSLDGIRRRETEQVTQRREQVDALDEIVDDGALADALGPAPHQRDAVDGLGDGDVLSHQAVLAGEVAVIGGEDDDGVCQFAGRPEVVDDAADLLVDERYQRVVVGDDLPEVVLVTPREGPRFACPLPDLGLVPDVVLAGRQDDVVGIVAVGILRRRRVRRVRALEAHPGEEGRLGVALAQPLQRLVGRPPLDGVLGGDVRDERRVGIGARSDSEVVVVGEADPFEVGVVVVLLGVALGVGEVTEPPDVEPVGGPVDREVEFPESARVVAVPPEVVGE